MFYNRALTFNFKERRGGFSLAEVVITLLIISIILILAAPYITKRLVPQKTEGVVFTYDGSNTNVNHKCFVYDNFSNSYISTNECSEYRFTVPDGVEKVNLTLVAGGGGGGGAGGGIINEKTQIVEMPSGKNKTAPDETFGNSLQSFIRNIKIKFLAAKGLDGQKISSADDLFQYDSDSANEVKIKQAKGGNSSPAVVDFIIPQELYRTPYDNVWGEYINVNNTIRATSMLASGDTTKTSVFTLTPRSGNNIIITADSTKGEISCAANGGNCKIPDKNIIMPVLSKATSAYSLDLSSLPYQSDKSFGTIAGGNGGKLPVYSTYGKGGNGTNINCSNSTLGVSYSLKDFLNSKKNSTAQSNMYSWLGQNDIKCYAVETGSTRSGSEGAIIYSYEVETPGGVGGGGSGGGAIRIVDFQVTSGETYVIRVGKGGAGGGSGQYGYRTYNTNDPLSVIRRKAAQSGGDGGNGVSTSIWEVNGNNETLVYFITGGEGGSGGHVQNIANDRGAPATSGAAGSIIPVIASGTDENLDVKNFDTTISNTQANAGCTDLGLGNFRRRCLSSAKFYTSGDNIVQPYAYLNNRLTIANNFNGNNGGTTLSGLSGNDYTEDRTIRTFNTITYLTAFFQRVAVGSDIGYIGGLGGFSPIGAKAGCGGLFFGNQNGYNGNNNPEYIANNAKTFEVRSFTANQFTLYKVSDYYDGCSTSTPDGHSAEFIMPNPKTKDLGQAGAGGGGGGYMLFKGAGKGGDGQNGYVMIDWRK